jgi:hypothetical protein
VGLFCTHLHTTAHGTAFALRVGMSKATHSGHCQACGSLQKLPNGRLSNHGYKVEYGFFSGICRGSKFMPFEVSHDQVERYIAEAKAHRAKIKAFCRMLRADVSNKAHVSNYEMNPRTGRSGYQIREVEVQVTSRIVDYGPSYGGRTEVFDFFYEAPGFRAAGGGANEKHKIDIPFDLKLTTVEEVASWLNAKHADKIEATDVKQLTSYIRWQEERVANWKPGALLPVNAKDKAGFKLEGEK